MEASILERIIKKLDHSRQRNQILRKKFLKGNEASVISEIENKIVSGILDLDTLRCLIDLLLISNSPTIYKKYDLKGLEKFLKNLCRLYPEDIDLNLEYYYFLFNVLDEEKKAKSHMKSFSSKVFAKIPLHPSTAKPTRYNKK
jgi:hypothetical protein